MLQGYSYLLLRLPLPAITKNMPVSQRAVTLYTEVFARNVGRHYSDEIAPLPRSGRYPLLRLMTPAFINQKKICGWQMPNLGMS